MARGRSYGLSQNFFGIDFLTGTETDRMWNLHGDGRILSSIACLCSKPVSFKRERLQEKCIKQNDLVKHPK